MTRRTRKPRSGNQELEIQTDSTQESEPLSMEPEPEKPIIPGRPARQPLQDDGIDPRDSKTREELAEFNERRARRKSMGSYERLEALAEPYLDPNFYMRFVIDKPGRLEEHRNAEYEFVLDSSGKHVTFPSGSNHLHLMKLPVEFRNDDLEEREKAIAARVGSQASIGAGEYSPEGAESALITGGSFQPDS